MLSKVNSAALSGLEAMPVSLEINTMAGQTQSPVFLMVGLPDSAVRESRTRVESALINSGLHLPQVSVVVNFAPADVKKEGSGYDLPLALGLLAANKLIRQEAFEGTMFVGELGLDGSIRPVRGSLPIAIKARAMGFKNLVVPMANIREAGVVNKLRVFGAERLSDVVGWLQGKSGLEEANIDTRSEFLAADDGSGPDFADVKGQQQVKRACEVAAAGGHNLLLVGSPGCGKSMIAKRIPSILPKLTMSESLETTQIHSVAGKLGNGTSLITRRPFRAPHHTISDVALIGGGSTFQPGEISLAHNGVLFLDELPEFNRQALETLRQPLEDRVITVSRAKYSITLPCSFMLVASMNPCPCGYYNHPTRSCTCNPGQRQRYMGRVSGPLLDRIDIQIEVTPVPVEDLANAPSGEPSSAIRDRVVRAREIQSRRFEGCMGIHCNAQMTDSQLEQFARPDSEGADRLSRAMKALNLSARAYSRILKVARTIADLDGEEKIGARHIAEAVGYRNLDRSGWGE